MDSIVGILYEHTEPCTGLNFKLDIYRNYEYKTTMYTETIEYLTETFRQRYPKGEIIPTWCLD